MRKSSIHRSWTVLVAAVLCLATTPTFAAPTGALSGLVTGSGSSAPVEGAVVLAGDPDGTIHSSSPAGADGRFELSGLAPATYRVAVRKGDRLWVVASPVTLAPGQARILQVAIDPSEEQAPSPAEAREKEKKRDRLGFWNNPLTATLVVVGAAIVVGVALDAATDDNNETPASPTLP